MTTEVTENTVASSKKRGGKIELVIGAVLGGLATFAADYANNNFFNANEPLAQGVTELSHLSKELILEQKSLNKNLEQLANKTASNPEIKVEIGDIINRVNNIVETTLLFESKSRNVTQLANAARSRNHSAIFNANADLALAEGEGVTICGNENTLAVVKNGTDRRFKIKLDGVTKLPATGSEYPFKSPLGDSLVSYLGQSGQLHQFRLVCKTEVKKG